MKPLLQELDRAIERGWANGGHLAAIRELAVEAANEPQRDLPTVGEAVLVRAVDAWEQWWNGYTGTQSRDTVRECLRHVLASCLPAERAVAVPVVEMGRRSKAVGHD